ncbi:hypothetical protein [Streptomyces sp. NPDC048611]|uniref:hypothetical protein n=1 Tax=Streptomyces sp. NPDC048611 TaxID=3155635 RepID=UPI0034280E6E
MTTATPKKPTTEPVMTPELAMAYEFDRTQQRLDVNNGQTAELRHYLDADPDTCVPLPGIPHPKPAQAA